MNKYLALDLGGTFLKAAIIDENINVIEKWKVTSKHATTIDELLAVFDEAVLGHIKDCVGIAISMPGRIDVLNGVAKTGGAFDSFMHEYNIRDVLADRYNLKVSVDNDAKCAANAELWKGALKDCTNGLVYVIGTAIGGGIIINHQLYRGNNLTAGELSQALININDDIKLDNFVFEKLATPFLLKEYKLRNNLDNQITGEYFFDRVNDDDKIANEILKEFIDVTAKYLYNLQTCFDVEKVAIGGGISQQPILLEMLNKKMDEIYNNTKLASIRPEIVRCKFSNDANLIGAVKTYVDIYGE